ncbi:MAG TPA: M13 family metallopeptidase, partial [Moheibacter sp.]|nr:M13 family metallopeptidase [Moheibacter sp.]
KGSDEQKIGDLYKSFIDFDARDKAGIKPIEPYLQKIDNIKSIGDLQNYLTEVTPLGFNPFYGFSVDSHLKNSSQNAVYLGSIRLGLGRAYYQKDDEANRHTLENYIEFINKIYPFTGQKTKDLKGPGIVNFEKETAKYLLTIEERRDANLMYNPYSINDLKKLSKNVDLAKYLSDLGVKTDSVIITEKKYFENLDKIINEKNLPALKVFLKFQLINSQADNLTKELDELSFDFYGRQLRGQKEQRALEKRGLEFVNGAVGELLGKIYVKEYFPPEAKAKAQEMIDYLFRSFDVHIKNLEWMSPETKEKALAKLNNFTVKIGYPDKWEDYSKLEIVSPSTEGAYYQNLLNIRKWAYNDKMSKIGKPVDKSEWGMSPQTVNAYYNPSYNEIVFPAAILQPPFYNYKADAAINFGGMGAVIGHEMSHGFDDSGAQFDGEGNLKNWWTESDFTKFKAAGKALADQYSQYEPVKGSFVNGEFTLGENIGDLGGMSVAYDALQMYLKDHGNPGEIDGFTQNQRFFISWATIWRTKSTDESLKNQVKTDPHSPGYYRAIGPLENIEGFYEAFGVKEGDKMYKPKNERIIIW